MLFPETCQACGRRVAVRLAAFLAALGALPAFGAVLINEIMYHPPPAVPEDPRSEWIELFNSGPQAVDLSGWSLRSGVHFTFPQVVLPAGGFVVVAADVAAFRADHPTVTNVTGGWTGKLSNRGEKLELADAAGQTVNSVTYSAEGDWASRRAGEMYPGQPAWWRGWQWATEADGGGKSLELVNPALPNTHGQNWSASRVPGGTPGAANSVAASDAAPLILDVHHAPALPRATDAVVVTARLLDEGGTGLEVRVLSRADGAPDFTATPMADDGAHGDGLAGDGYYGAILPARPDKTVVEFYVAARDAAGLERTWPAPTDETGAQEANALYQVDGTAYAGNQPLYRFIFLAAEWNAWTALMDGGNGGENSDAAMNGTLVRTDGLGTEVRYRVHVRNRGAGTRNARPHNLHLALPDDDPLQGVRTLNFNTRTVHSQAAGNALFSLAGLPNAYGAPVQVRINGANLAHASPTGSVNSYQFGSYYCFQPYNSDWAAQHFPADPDGNLYKGAWYFDDVQLTNGAVLEYLGTNVANYRTAYGSNGPTAHTGAYQKQNNTAADDWSDLLALCHAFSETPDPDYLTVLSARVNVEEWLGYFAANSLLLNMETCLATGDGDDYSLYGGVTDARFQVLIHDLDTVLGQGDATPSTNRSIFKAAELPVLDRFLKHPDIAPPYFARLLELANGPFNAAQIGAALDQVLGGWVPASYLENMKGVAAARRAAVLAQIPLSLTVTSSLPVVSGYPRTTNATATLAGRANAVATRSVRVNGTPAGYVPWQGAWSATNIALFPGINRVLIQTLDAHGTELARTNLDLWHDAGGGTSAGGTISTHTTWAAAFGPYTVTSSLTVASNATLTIEPGTTLYLGAGVNFTVAAGGALRAEGTATAPIRFTVAPGSGVSWGRLTLNGAAGSPESRLAFAHFEGNGASPCLQVTGATVVLDALSFGNTARQYLALDGASFVVSRCVFPTATAAFEAVHGTGGIKAGGRGIIRDCLFGAVNGYNDSVDFTGGNRDFGQPLIEFYNNVFLGSGDDALDLDGTDAWVEGNIFLHVHKNGAPDSSSAVSGGNNGSATSEITLVRNLFFDCDHAATAKQGNFYTLLNNTIVRTTSTGGTDTNCAVVNVRDIHDDGTTTTWGAGGYLEGNLIVDAPQLVRNYAPAQTSVTFSNNFMPLPWTGPGGGNLTNNPRLKHLPQPAETQFTSWQQAQVLWDWFSLLPGSPARGTGPNGVDAGAVIPGGVSLDGVPAALTPATNLTVAVGTGRTGNGIPPGGFPNGAGYTHYRWRLDGGAWSAENPLTTPITLTGLDNGPHQLEAIGRRDSGGWQDAPDLGTNALVTTRSWSVDATSRAVVLNELLADNRAAYFVGEDTPDAIELFNPGAQTLDLSGVGLTDDLSAPFKFAFPPGVTLGPGQFLVVIADRPGTGPHHYAGFKLDKDGGTVALFAAPASGGALLDAVTYGPQLTDYSIGRLADGTWGLNRPTLGTGNLAAPVGAPQFLRLNEWLAASLVRDDFVELHNGDTLPVDLGGCFLSDVPETWPARHRIAPLSFIPAQGQLAFLADGNAGSGSRHLDFKLAQEWGTLALFAPDLSLLDRILYGPQTAEVSMGRTPNGGGTLAFFPTPTPGAGNPGASGPCTVSNVSLTLMSYAHAWRYNQSNNLDGLAWFASEHDDSMWEGPGEGLLAYENNAALTPLIRTPLRDPRSPPPGLTSGHAYYFRTWLVVSNDLSPWTVTARMRLDDCGVIYINGVEFARPRMPAGLITNGTFGGGAVGGNTEATADESFLIPSAWLPPGANLIAVEVHQNGATSSDIVWGLALEATRAFTNCAPAPVVLSEVLARPRAHALEDGSVTDWLELFNPAAEPLDLAGMSLSDNSANPRRWVVPAGVVLGPGDYLVVRCDGGAPASAVNGPALNTGFGLRAGGGAVYLFSAAGSLVDALTYGAQAADYSLARAAGEGGWTLGLPTPGAPNLPAATGEVSALRLNEWAASVPDGPDWFELYNPLPQPVALGGCFLTDNLNNRTKHPIAPLTFVGTGGGAYAVFIADGDTAQGADHVNFALSASGEALGLFPPGAALAVDSFSFGPQTAGVSEGRLPDGGATRAFFTRPSAGAANWLPLPAVVINEVLTHTDPPLEDAVEIANLSGVAVDLGGWHLSDSEDDLWKFRIPNGAVLPPHGFITFYEHQFNPAPGASQSFSFSSARGDEVWLTATDGYGQPTGYRAMARFGPQFNGVAVGRYLTSVGVEFTPLTSPTFGTAVTAHSPTNQLELFRSGVGAPNAPPRVGPVVISEIMYRPPPVGTNDDTLHEFLELHNVSGAPVPLFDPLRPANGWRLRGGVDFAFNTHHLLPVGGYLVVVGFDPATNGAALASFQARYGADLPLAGPWSGKLANAGEEIELLAPDAPQTTGPDAGLVPAVGVDRVVYSNRPPWKTGADGAGQSLQRLVFTAFGNDPANWIAAVPSASASGQLDSDGDGIPDTWEDEHGLNKHLQDAGLDPDGDGFTNAQEYTAGTDPRSAASRLQLTGVTPSPGGTVIAFPAAAGRAYSVLYRETLDAGPWLKLADVAAPPADAVITVTDSAGLDRATRYYRLVTPAMP